MKKLKIAVLPGDGIGPEVMKASLPIFDVLEIPVELKEGVIGWSTWESDGNPILPETWELIHQADATLLGAITSKPAKEAQAALPAHLKNNPPEYVSPVIQLRQSLDLYVNIRPCFNIKQARPAFDFTVIRENTEGLYAGFDFHPLPPSLETLIKENSKFEHESMNTLSCALRLQSESGLKRLFEFAFHFAEQNGHSRVTLADKPNVLRKSGAFARDIFESVAGKYPHIRQDIVNIDALALWMVRRPEEWGVIVAENMFGDILSDLGAGVMGGLGFAPSANIGKAGCYFEPVHGSAPRIAFNKANPSAMFLTIGMLLSHFGYSLESARIKNAVTQVIREGRSLTYDLGGDSSTQQMADAILKACLSPKKIKKIGIIATGNEIVSGELADGNGHTFSKVLSEHGVDIYQKMQVCDGEEEIRRALEYQLSFVDAVITTGGLGPTSDDNTRNAIAKVTQKALIHHEIPWQHIVKRFEEYKINLSDSNKKQALFPEGCHLYPNKHGSAFGARITTGGREKEQYIFMLPGPPKECIPMFYEYVLPELKKLHFCSERKIYRWLTLGLIESEIASVIDNYARGFPVETGYRWNYPYLEIKIMADAPLPDILKQMLDKELMDYTVSTEGKDAFEILDAEIQGFVDVVQIFDCQGKVASFFEGKSHFILINDLKDVSSEFPLFSFETSRNLDESSFGKSILFKCYGKEKEEITHENELMIPCRDIDIIRCAKAYCAWQLSKFIKKIKRKRT